MTRLVNFRRVVAAPTDMGEQLWPDRLESLAPASP